MKKINWRVLVISLLVVYSVAAIGSFFTSGNTEGEWYESVKPSITPPGWVFPIVWNALFFLIALSLYFAWINAKNKNKLVLAFGVNFLLNILWSYFYFYLKSPSLAFIEIIVLELSIIFMVIVTYRINKKSAYLLLPYLIWVGFATILNYLSL